MTQINLGTETGTSVIEIRNAVEKIKQRTVNSTIVLGRFGDPPNLVSLPKRAKEVLGWQPENSSADQLIGDAWNWHLREISKLKVT